MKGIKLFLSAAFAAVPTLLTGCSAGPDGPVPDDPQGPGTELGVAASIVGSATRAYGTTWEAGDAIMISCLGYSGSSQTGFSTDPMKDYIGYRYVTASGGDASSTAIFAADSSTGPIWFKNTSSSYKFCAVYPAFDVLESDGMTKKTYALKTGLSQGENAGTGNKRSIDVLVAEATASGASPDAAFTFSHKMAQLRVNFTLDTDEGFNEDESTLIKKAACNLNNLKLSGSLAYDGKITVSDDVTTSWNPVTAGKAAKTVGSDNHSLAYNLILLPQTVENFSLVFKDTQGNLDYNLASMRLLLESGKITTLDINVKRNSLEVVSCSITPWTTETKDEVKVPII